MKPGELYWSLLDPIWNKIDTDTPETFAQTFESISRDTGLLYAAHFCQSEVCNGGFTQLFLNSTGVLAPEAVDGFRAIGQPHIADLLQRAMEMLGSPFPRDRAARQTSLDVLREQGGKQPDLPTFLQYKNIDSFQVLEREFYSQLASEAGGFEKAADAYASKILGNL